MECEDLYAGRIDEARKRLLVEWPALKRSLMFRKCQTFRIMLFYMRARTALAAWTLRRRDRILIEEIELYISRLKNARSPWGTALGEAIESSLEAGRGHVKSSDSPAGECGSDIKSAGFPPASGSHFASTLVESWKARKGLFSRPCR